jgi:UPF0042 nucleotide-binding protein
MSDTAPVRLFMVTGMSGAGKSSALNVFEDLGFETVDNLPVELLAAALRGGGPDRPLAVGVDVRTRDFDAEAVVHELNELSQQSAIVPTLLYLDCDDDVLIRRFTETRRPHPLANERPVINAIAIERDLLAPLRRSADHVIDTSALSAADLRRTIEKAYGVEGARRMHVHLVSFGYRNGVPRDADLVFDARFLRNPHYVPDLKPLTGLDTAVGAYIAKDPDYESFVANVKTLLTPLLPRYRDEGKSYLTIAIGCTGGRHRSVYVVERLAEWLSPLGFAFDFRHRDLNLDPSGPGNG